MVILLGSLKASRSRGRRFLAKVEALEPEAFSSGGSCTSKSGSPVERKRGAGSCGDSPRLGGRSVSSERFVLSVFER